jgi:hypothetical protein
MAIGKTIRIYLADGSASGIRHAEMVNWTGQALICPRTRVGDLKDWPETQRPGTYFLFGFDEQTGGKLVYIGEAENVWGRLQDHLKKKDFWQEVVIITSKDENLTKAHVRYLESRFVALAKAAKRYPLLNGTDPQAASLPRPDRDAMEEFIDHARPLLSALGHRVLEPQTVPPVQQATPPGDGGIASSPVSAVVFHFAKPPKFQASGMPTDEGFIIFKGSRASVAEQPSIPAFIQNKRNEFKRVGWLRENEGTLLFTDDVTLPSPSAAAAVVKGGSVSGPAEWKTSEGVSLGEYEAQRAQQQTP